MRKLLPLVLAATVSACAALSTLLQTEALYLGTQPLVEYHDRAVSADLDLTLELRADALRESALLLDLLLSQEELSTEDFAAALLPVVERFDMYLDRAWPGLNIYERRFLSRTSQLARDLAGLPPHEYPAAL